MWLDVILLCVGAILVLFGADRLTEGASALARRFCVSEMVIGLTVVAFGTSLPEFVTSLLSACKGSGGISVGNIVGSNIFNTLLIVGGSALACPILVSKSTIRKDIPFAVLATVVLIIVTSDAVLEKGSPLNLISRTDGLVMLCLFLVFMAYTFTVAYNKTEDDSQEVQAAPMPVLRISVLIVIGLLALLFGGSLFVDSARGIALGLGVSETVVGLTIVAAGTSLPELATSIMAACKGRSAIAIGNVIGSNIFNVFFVTGFCASVSPINAGGISITDMAVMLVSMLMFWYFSYTKRTIERWEGAVMVLVYVAYMGYLVCQA